MEAESLVSVGRWQWRSSAMYRLTTREAHSDELHLWTRLERRLGEWRGIEIKWHGGAGYLSIYDSPSIPLQEDRWLLKTGLEFRRW